MRSQQQSPTWPYLAILACLFVLSVTAPRAWQRMASEQSVAQALSARPQRVRPVQPTVVLAEASQAEDFEAAEAVPAAQLALEDGSPQAATESEEEEPEAPAEESPYLVTPQPAIASQAVAEANQPATEEPAPAPPATELAESPQPVVSPEAEQIAESDRVIEATAPEPAENPASEHANAPTAAASVESVVPISLLDQLSQLAAIEACSPWATETSHLLREMWSDDPQAGLASAGQLKLVRQQLERSKSIAARLSDPLQAALMARVRYALARRLDVWEHLPPTSESVLQSRLAKDLGKMSSSLAEVDRLTSRSAAGPAWREYLQVERLKRAAHEDRADSTRERRRLARNVLARLSQARSTHNRQKFLTAGPVAALDEALVAWASEPVDARQLLVHLEAYERTGLASDARRLAEDCRWLAAADEPRAKQLAGLLTEHYRNANFRLAIAGSLVNRLVPQPAAMSAAVNDTVVGATVRGRSTTFTKLQVKLVPDPRRLRLGLEAEGLVASDTASTSGPATFYNRGESSFLVRKLFLFGPSGLRVFPAIAQADSYYTNLLDLETTYDRVPLVSGIVRNIARSKHDEARGEARSEVEQKVASKALLEIDGQLEPKLTQTRQKFAARVLDPLEHLGLEMTPIDMSTTEDRLAMRLRLAALDQLGASTPRPRAPSDSMISLQLHQSALNNALGRLELEGRRFTLPELFQWIGGKFSRPHAPLPADLPDDVVITFAEQNAIRLAAQDGRLEITIAVAELVQGSNRWRNFSVRTFYRPDAKALDARFTRDSGVYLEGSSLKRKPQVVLRSIFSKVLAANKPWSLVDAKIARDPRLQDLAITQFVVDDGWIGLAYAPKPARTLTSRPRLDKTLPANGSESRIK